jgi:hypothetical protein
MFVVHIPYTGVTTIRSQECQHLHKKWSINSKHGSNCITTRLMATRQRKNESSIHGRTSSYLHVFRLALEPKCPYKLTLADINREWGSQDVRLTTLLHLVLRLRMRRAITPILIHLLEIVLTYAQGQLELLPLKAQFFWEKRYMKPGRRKYHDKNNS